MLCFLLVVVAGSVLWVLLNIWYRKPFVDHVTRKRVFITGTDSGFGRELALSLDAKGLRVYAGCYTDNGAEELRRVASNRMLVLNIDVSKVDSIRKAKEIVERDLPSGDGLWGVVNNAGISRAMLIGLATVDDFRDVLDVNFFGTVSVNEIFAPLVKQAQGRIVNVISAFPRLYGPCEPYVCSKAALLPYTDGLRRWMKLFDVHVAAMEPGYCRTEMTNSSFLINDNLRTWKRLPDQLKEEYGDEFLPKYNEEIASFAENCPLPLFNKVSHVIDAMTHALLAKHPKSRYITGLDSHYGYRLAMFMYSPDWLIDYFVNKSAPSLQLIRKRVLKQRALEKKPTN